MHDIVTCDLTWAGSSAERAAALLAVGRRFKSFSAHHFVMINRSEINKYLGFTSITPRFRRDLQTMLTRGKKFGLVKSINQKSFEISKGSQGTLENIAQFLCWMNENETENLRTQEETEILIDGLILSGKSQVLTVMAFLCPSYKKGLEACGFNSSIGETTKRGIKNTYKVYSKLKELGFGVEMLVIFSDLVLENYDELKKNGDLDDINQNVLSAREFTNSISGSISFKRLSDYSFAKERIPLKGIEGEPNRVPKSVYNLVLRRNMNFYINQFGWCEQKVLDRTKILACTYPVIGDFFRRDLGNILFVYTANSLERSRMYQGLEAKTNPIPIFFPKKGRILD